MGNLAMSKMAFNHVAVTRDLIDRSGQQRIQTQFFTLFLAVIMVIESSNLDKIIII